MNLSIRHLLIAGVALAVVVVGTATRSDAQALGWEGETGVFVTPLAYTAASETEKIHPVVGYHYLNAGSVIGDFHEASITVGFLKRFEMGYTHEFHTQGDDKSLSPLWQNGFEIFHGKAMLIPENYTGKMDSDDLGRLHGSAERAQRRQLEIHFRRRYQRNRFRQVQRRRLHGCLQADLPAGSGFQSF